MSSGESSLHNSATFFLLDDPVWDVSEANFGFGTYAQGLADKISGADAVHAGVAVGIYGRWGSGKTSLMLLLKQELENRRHPTVWFDAWQYAKQEDLWIALLRVTQKQIERQSRWPVRIWFNAWTNTRIWWGRLDWSRIVRFLGRVVLRSILAFGIIYAVVAVVRGLLPILPDLAVTPEILGFLQWLARAVEKTEEGVIYAGLVGVTTSTWRWLVALITGKLDVDLSLLTRPGPQEEYGAILIDEVKRDFRNLLNAAGRRKSVVIFIDDLDRCAPDQIVPVLEAIKQLTDLDVKGQQRTTFLSRFLRNQPRRTRASFVLGIDRDVVEQAINVHYKEYKESASITSRADGQTQPSRSLGREYLEKIVEVTFQLPHLFRVDVTKLFSNLLSEQDSQPYLSHGGTQERSFWPVNVIVHITERLKSIRLSIQAGRNQNAPQPSRNSSVRKSAQKAIAKTRPLFEAGLRRNPRAIKRALNEFTLVWESVPAHESLVDVEPTVIALLTLIRLRWPDVYQSITEYPNLLQDLHDWAKKEYEYQDEILQLGCPNPKALLERYRDRYPDLFRLFGLFPGVALLDLEVLEELPLLTSMSEWVPTTTEFEVAAELMSGDPTRIYWGVKKYPDEVKAHVDWLVGRLESKHLDSAELTEQDQEKALFALCVLVRQVPLKSAYAINAIKGILASKSSGPRLRLRALYALSRFADEPQVQDRLCNILSEPNNGYLVRSISLKGLAKQQSGLSPRARQAVVNIALVEENVNVVLRDEAARLTASLALYDETARIVAQALDREDSELAHRFMTFLSGSGKDGLKQRAIIDILARIGRESPDLREEAVDKLSKVEPTDVAIASLSTIYQHMTRHNEVLKIVQALGNLQGDQVVTLLLQIEEDQKNRDVTIQVMDQLHKLPDMQAVDFLIKKLDDPDPGISVAADRALAELAENGPEDVRKASLEALDKLCSSVYN